MCRDRESRISVIQLMVDLRVVDILGVDIILDMDELTTIGLSVIMTLAGLSFPTWSWSWVRLHMHVVGCVCAWNFGTKFFLRRGECKTRENSNFLKKGKIVISVKILNFSRSWMMKRISLLESSREIYLLRRISSNFETIRICTFFEASRIGCRKTTYDVTKVTYNMYSCDTCFMSRERMEMDGRDSAKCQKSKT